MNELKQDLSAPRIVLRQRSQRLANEDSEEKIDPATMMDVPITMATLPVPPPPVIMRIPSQRKISEAVKHPHVLRCMAVEFLGCAIFILIGSLQGLSGGGVMAAAAAHGITIAVLITSMGHISGGHFNPAVSLGVFLTGHLEKVPLLLYIPSQLCGGLAGSLLARACVSNDQWAAMGGGFTIPAYANLHFLQGYILETILTLILVQTVLMTAIDTGTNLFAPFAIGLSIFVDILAGGNISGASMNPARSLGPSLVGLIFPIENKFSLDMHYIYWAGPSTGAVLAALIYRFLLSKDHH